MALIWDNRKLHLPLGPEWPGKEVLRQLVQRASGLFVLASTRNHLIPEIIGFEFPPSERQKAAEVVRQLGPHYYSIFHPWRVHVRSCSDEISC
jgi:hypothetical protein